MQKSQSLILATTILAISLVGCSQRPTTIPKLSESQREERIQAMQTWQLKARLGVKEKTSGQNVSLEWQQRGPAYDLFIYSPLGNNSAKIVGGPSYVTMTMADGQTFANNSAEELVLDHLGWHLPFSNLVYWIKGLPAPEGDVSNLKTDRFNQMQSFVQDGWTVQYQSYAIYENISLPTRISLSKGDIKLKLAIRDWQLS